AEMISLREKVGAWVDDRIEEFKTAAEPAEVGGRISDRMEEVAEPLLVIADTMGIGAKTRAAIRELCTSEAAEDASIGNRLLADIRELFRIGGQDRMTSSELLSHLTAIESSPWGSWHKGFPIKPHGAARLLKPYGIKSTQVRDENGHNVQGFRREQFEDAWNRYLLPPVAEETDTAPGVVEETDPGFTDDDGLQGMQGIEAS